jgi:hypothetical protein
MVGFTDQGSGVRVKGLRLRAQGSMLRVVSFRV